MTIYDVGLFLMIIGLFGRFQILCKGYNVLIDEVEKALNDIEKRLS